MVLRREHRGIVDIVLTLPALVYLSFLIFAGNQYDTWRMVYKHAGYIALGLTTTVIALNPILATFPKLPLVSKLNLFRRDIGVAAFGYICLHFFTVVGKTIFKYGYLSFSFLTNPLVLTGFATFLILLALAATSNNYSVKTLGGNKWKKLHRLVYLAEVLIFSHLLLKGGRNTYIAFAVFIPLVLLQLWRIKKKRDRNQLT